MISYALSSVLAIAYMQRLFQGNVSWIYELKPTEQLEYEEVRGTILARIGLPNLMAHAEIASHDHTDLLPRRSR
jgi:hypothetical protein